MTKINTGVTDDDIRSLQAEAHNVGDTAQVELCRRALKGDQDALKECTRVILETRVAAAD